VDPDSGFQLHIRPYQVYPSASTMKVGVMLSLYRLTQKKRIDLDKKIPVQNSFRSVIRGKPYQVPKEEKEDCACVSYKHLGERLSLRDLNNDMIRSSSNLATNLLMNYIGKKRIAQELSLMGVKRFWISRGLYDMYAFRRNWHNKLTAYGTYRSLSALTSAGYFKEDYRNEMLALLATTEHRDKIPALLPPGVRVAQKSGYTDDVSHDAAIIYPEPKSPYYLVFLTEGHKDQVKLEEKMARASKIIYEVILNVRK
jgi:beta-lactamase class A